ncbi:MAG: kelch repeat-containing protein [Segetibacter sp.]
MKQIVFYCIALLTTIPGCMIAKKQVINHINWKVASTLPVPTGADKQPGLAGAWAGVHNHVLIVAGGANFPDTMPWLGGKKKYYTNVYVFTKNVDGNVITVNKTFHLPFPVAYGASCSTSEGIVCAGGENENGISNKVLLMQWNAATTEVVFKTLPDLPVAVTNTSITVNDNMVYLAGGEVTAGVSNQFLSLNVNNTSSGWKQLPALPKAVSHAAIAAQSDGDNTCIYLIGGRKRNANSTSDLYSFVYQFDLKDNRWKEKRSLPYALSAGTALATGSNHILLFSGDKGETFQKTEELIAAINTEKDEAKKQQLIQQKTELQSTHPGFSKDVLLYNTLTNAWAITDTIPFEGQVTTTAVKWEEDIIIPSGEIKAGVRTPRIIAGKIPSQNQLFR